MGCETNTIKTGDLVSSESSINTTGFNVSHYNRRETWTRAPIRYSTVKTVELNPLAWDRSEGPKL